MKTYLYSLLLVVIACSCASSSDPELPTRSRQIEERAQAYFATYAERSDWEHFCSFYREDLHFHDVILQLQLDSLWKFKRFYQWDQEGDRFRKLSPEQQHLQIESLLTDDSTAVARGRVNPFYYDGYLIDSEWGMEFTIWLYFDEDFRIRRQIDWIEYDPSVLESMLERVRKNGHEAMPEWLDLSPEGSE